MYLLMYGTGLIIVTIIMTIEIAEKSYQAMRLNCQFSLSGKAIPHLRVDADAFLHFSPRSYQVRYCLLLIFQDGYCVCQRQFLL